MGDSSTENNEFQFYLLLVRQYIFQLPEEDERVRAAAWMVHLRRLRDAKDLKLRNDYIKLLLFAMHSRCLIGPFAQPPQKDKGLEHFPKNFTFPEMMRHLIEGSNAPTMGYCQSKHEDQSHFTSGECRVKVKVQEKLEDPPTLPAVSLTQPQVYRHDFEDNVTPREYREGIVTQPAASWVSGLTSDSSNITPDLKVENVTKEKDESRKKCQSITEDASVTKEEGIKSPSNAHKEPQIMQDTSVSLHKLREQISLNSNSSTCEKYETRDQWICNGELHEKNQTPRNSSQFTDTLKTNIQDDLNRAHYTDGKNINNEAYSPCKYSDYSHYQHCYHHHHHKSPVCHSNEQKISALEMGVTGRKYLGQMPPQIPVNGGMTTYPKQDFPINCCHSCFSTDFRETRRKQQNSACWIKENAHNNLGTNALLLNYDTVYDRHTTNLSNRQAQENSRCSMSTVPVTENTHSSPLVINNRKCSAECRSSAEITEQGTHSDEIIQKNIVTQNYITGNGVDTTENPERHKSVIYDSGRICALNMKHDSHEEDPKTTAEGQLFSASELKLPLHATNKLSMNEVSVRQQKSAQEMHLQGPSKQFHTQTETQENMGNNQRHSQSTEDIPTDMIPKAKSSEFNVAKFRASLSADLGAYSAGYASGYSAGYAAGIAAALNSSAEHLYSALQ